ncbi:MAG: hypothetical protein A2V78_01200 [Betaproteobacteria bacterium RBG_16_64_18]|nr:MAG: hypothetical protein A2V78_01200 [Betaproteobacteria bacterium RBG_16_64_18]OGA10191.1 MAG: hypothetical protein A3H33_00740 [Betaproteobacteria bacterium RIFCSPLOWO2_02_FULL_65_20]OGA39939.1 MAG: hypothetical protein A3G26_09900 [Betaproteobacteria bacterium RIFCSPLOWO2_12_FULL_65_110]
MKEKLKLTEVWFKIVLLFVFSGFYILAIPYPQESGQFPQLLAAISLILTLAALAADFLRAQVTAGEIGDVDDTELKVVDTATRNVRRRRFYQAWAILLVSTGVGYLGGFLFSTVLLFGGFGLAFGRRENLVKNMIVAVAMTVVVYFIFGRIMAVPLLNGVLW